MTTEMFNNFMEVTHPNVIPYVFIVCIIIIVLFAIVATIRDKETTLENVTTLFAVGFFISMFIAAFWPLCILGLLFIGFAAFVYYPARYCRKFFWV